MYKENKQLCDTSRLPLISSLLTRQTEIVNAIVEKSVELHKRLDCVLASPNPSSEPEPVKEGNLPSMAKCITITNRSLEGVFYILTDILSRLEV